MVLTAMLYNESSSGKWSQVLGIIGTWETKCLELLIPVEAFKEVYNYLRNHQVPTNSKGQPPQSYGPLLNFTNEINAEKLSQLNCNELSSITRIRSCKNLPPTSKMSNNSRSNHSHSKKDNSHSLPR